MRTPEFSRRALLTSAMSMPLVAALEPGSAIAAEPSEVGRWSAPFDIGGIAIHAISMHNNQILFFQYAEDDPAQDHTSYAATYDCVTGVTREAPFPYDRDVFCAGHVALAGGRIFIAGGHAHSTGHTQDPIGVRETDIYNPTTRKWTPTPRLGEARWYPTVVSLPNGRCLVFGGSAQAGIASPTVDEYNPRTGRMRTLAATATRTLGYYPRMHLMANGRILMSGPRQMSAYFHPERSSWSNVAPMRYGARNHGTVALLPGSRAVLTAGGSLSARGGPPTATCEILDTSKSTPRWRSTGPLNHARMLSNTVVMPDGTVFLVGGGAAFKYTDPVKVPELYNPRTETWKPMAPHQAGRMYHATALLLPDGRVFTAGQDDGPFARYAEIWSPPYLFRGRRPKIKGVPARVKRGGRLEFHSPQAARIGRVVLIKPGANTHEIDSDQRSVPLRFTRSRDTITARVPADGNVAPPGYYMVFALDRDGVPAVAPWIRVT